MTFEQSFIITHDISQTYYLSDVKKKSGFSGYFTSQYAYLLSSNY